MTAVIRPDALTKNYRRVAALDHVNLEVQEGAVYALVGQNGAGKTTVIKILMNLILASQGTAQVLGTDSRKIRDNSYTQIGYVSENQEIPEWMKVGALLDYLRDFYPTWDLALEQSLVKQFDFPLDRKSKALSPPIKTKLPLADPLPFPPPPTTHTPPSLRLLKQDAGTAPPPSSTSSVLRQKTLRRCERCQERKTQPTSKRPPAASGPKS